MGRTSLVFLCCALFTVVAFPQSPQRVTVKAIWSPGTAIMQEIRDQCGKTPGDPFGDCFLNMMQKSGATPEALAFTRQTGNLGYLRDFKDLGPVAVAFVHFPFRANENQGALIDNGSPAILDIDQLNLLGSDEIQRNLTYSMLAERAPQISLWPGERNGTAYMVTKRLPMAGVRVTVPYLLRNGCRACDVLGAATFAFDLDQSGRYLGTKLIGVTTRKANLSRPQ